MEEFGELLREAIMMAGYAIAWFIAIITFIFIIGTAYVAASAIVSWWRDIGTECKHTPDEFLGRPKESAYGKRLRRKVVNDKRKQARRSRRRR